MPRADDDHMNGRTDTDATDSVEALDERGLEMVEVTGRLDALEASTLRSTLAAVIERGVHRIIVDLRGADFVDSAGLAALVKYMKDARALGGDLRLVRPRTADANRVFALTKFDEVFVMADDPSALASSW